jgi:archaellum component FlaD/FlaE
MAIDPRTYDLDELRAASAAPARVDGVDSRTGDADGATVRETRRSETGATERPIATDRPAADAAFERAIRRDLATRDAATGGIERPYLTALPASLVAEAVIFEWLEYLVLQAGHEAAAEALSLYEAVGWLGEDAAATLGDYLSGLAESRANEANDLDGDDHRVSLHYVARLASLRRETA